MTAVREILLLQEENERLSLIVGDTCAKQFTRKYSEILERKKKFPRRGTITWDFLVWSFWSGTTSPGILDRKEDGVDSQNIHGNIKIFVLSVQ